MQLHFAWPCQGSIHIYYSRLHIVHFFYRRSVCVVPNTTSLSVGSGAKGWSILYTKAIMINSTLKTSLKLKCRVLVTEVKQGKRPQNFALPNYL